MSAGRNDPCPCGSGKRYKNCHGSLADGVPAQAPASAPRLDIVDLLDRAKAKLAAGDSLSAIANCREAVSRDSESVTAWNMLGALLQAAGGSEAEDAWRRALALDAGNPEARFHLGNLLRERGDAQGAVAEYRGALARSPGNAAVLNNLGLALEALGERDQALECYARVLSIDGNQSDALGNLANVQFDRGEFGECARTYDRLFVVRSDLPVPVLLRRAIALQKSGRLADAEACFRQADSRAPDDAQILANIGSLCVEQGRYGDADEPLVRALELDPANTYALSMLAHARAHRCAWEGIEALFGTLQKLLEADRPAGSWPVSPFPLLAMPMPPHVHLRAARQWAGAFRRVQRMPDPVKDGTTNQRIRLGFVSSDFRPHAVSTLMLELWERIDRGRFETYAYGIMPADTGPVGERIARAFEHFADISGDSARASAQKIRGDRIDILFDLNGYTQSARPEIFAMRPAPVQVNSMGFPGTLGAEWYDYIHVDAFVAPDSRRPDYTERFLTMPHAYVPSDTTRAPQGPPRTRRDYGFAKDTFVFCCFNNAFKILPGVFSSWMRVLRAVPDSVLWLLEASADAEANLRRTAERSGVAPARIVFAPRVPNAEHVARNAAADLFLDTAPYGAHTTTNDALLAGLPVLTCAGGTLASRNPGSQLCAIGLPEMVTTSPADYESMALRLARDRSELAAIRSRLGHNRSTYPLFDMARYARDLEERLVEIRSDYLASTASR